MIASLSGPVQVLRLDAAVIEVGGVGLLVHATPRTLAGLTVGQPARLTTTLVVREESLTLFGFVDDDERATFETLQTVSGIGPSSRPRHARGARPADSAPRRRDRRPHRVA
jgi:Holliday junction DNA helicase RuvA